MNKLSIYVFSLIFVACVVSVNDVIDTTLIPRTFALAIFTAIYTLFILLYFKKINISLDFFTSIFFLFTVYAITSLLWTYNVPLALPTLSRQFLMLAVFITTGILLRKYDEVFIKFLIKAVIILFFVASVPIIIDFIKLPVYSKELLYNITGISGHKNLYSSLAFLCSIFTVLGFLYFKKSWRIISIAALSVQLVLIVLLQTKAVYIAYGIFPIAAIIMLVLRRTKFINALSFNRTILGGIVLLIFLNVFFVFILPRLIVVYKNKTPDIAMSEEITVNSTMTERVLIWEKTYDVLDENKFTGVGANNWQIFFPASSLPEVYRIQDLNVTFQRPHNDFLWMLSEYGLIGFNIYYMFILFVVVALAYEFFKTNKRKYLLLTCGIIGFLCISFFDFPLERVEHNILLVLLLSISVHIIHERNKWRKFSLSNKSSKIALLFIMTLSLFAMYFSAMTLRGEYYTKKMYVERFNNNNVEVAELCAKAISISYTLDPTSIPLHWYKGNAHANKGNYSEALIDFKKAYRYHPYNHHVLNDLGSAFYLNGTIDSAKFYYKKSAEINPRFDEPKLNLMSIYISEGKYKKAANIDKYIYHDSQRRKYLLELINRNK